MGARRLQPFHETYVAARLSGRSRADAAAIVHRSETLARQWEREPWYEPLKQRLLGELIGNKLEVFVPLQPDALAALKTNLLAGELDAAKYVLDQIHGRPLQPQQVDQTIRHIDPDEVVRVLSELPNNVRDFPRAVNE